MPTDALISGIDDDGFKQAHIFNTLNQISDVFFSYLAVYGFVERMGLYRGNRYLHGNLPFAWN
jgi:hypothetical protein